MRYVNRLLAALLALALAVVAVLLIIEIIAAGVGAQPAVVHWHRAWHWAQRTEWQQGSVRVGCILAALVGLILLTLQLKRRRPSRLRVASASTDTAYTRRGVAASVRSAVGDVDGINKSSVTVRRRKVRVAATTAGLQSLTADALRGPVTSAAQARLTELELDPAPSLAVRVRTRSR